MRSVLAAPVLAILVGLTMFPLSPARVAAQTTAPNAPAPAPSALSPGSSDPVDQVTQNIRDRQFSPAVRLASKLLAGTIVGGTQLADGDRYELYMLKGTALIGTHENLDAIENFQHAAKTSQDPHDISVATWTVQLVRHASGQTYAPKTAVNGQRPKPIDLTDLDARPAAFNAFLADQLVALAPRLRSAGQSHTLPPIFTALQQVNDLRALDEVANGNDDTVSKVAADLLDHAHGLIGSALKQMLARLGDIEQYANQVSTYPQPQVYGNAVVQQSFSQRNGLSSSNRTELQDMIATCQKIHDAINAFGEMSKNSDDWSNLLSDADRIAGHAKDLLDNVNNNPGVNPGSVVLPYGGTAFPIYPGQAGGYPQNGYGGNSNGGVGTFTHRPTSRPTTQQTH